MEVRVAEISDIDQVQALMKKYQIASSSEEDKQDGFVTTLLSDEQPVQLITQENGLFIAEQDGKVVAFILAASWHF